MSNMDEPGVGVEPLLRTAPGKTKTRYRIIRVPIGEQQVRDRMISVRFSEEEIALIKSRMPNGDHGTFSAYIRRRVLEPEPKDEG